jgi:hypothetical protein
MRIIKIITLSFCLLWGNSNSFAQLYDPTPVEKARVTIDFDSILVFLQKNEVRDLAIDAKEWPEKSAVLLEKYIKFYNQTYGQDSILYLQYLTPFQDSENSLGVPSYYGIPIWDSLLAANKVELSNIKQLYYLEESPFDDILGAKVSNGAILDALEASQKEQIESIRFVNNDYSEKSNFAINGFSSTLFFNFPQLKHLDVSIDGLTNEFESTPNLEKLFLECNDCPPAESWRALNKLKKLDLYTADLESVKEATKGLENAPIEKAIFRAKSTKYGEKAPFNWSWWMSQAHKWKNLSALQIESNLFSIQDSLYLGERTYPLEKLKNLNLYAIYRERGTSGVLNLDLDGMPVLDSLDLNISSFEPSHLNIKGRASNLRSLSLYLDTNWSKFVKELRRFPKLEALRCMDKDVVESTAPFCLKSKHIKRLKGLKIVSLRVNNLESVPPKLGRLKSLEELVIITDKLKKIPSNLFQSSSLKELYLRTSSLAQTSIQLNCPTLKTLVIEGSTIHKFEIINAAALEELILKNIVLEQELKGLEKLANLKELYLPKGAINTSGITALKERFPNLKIVIE